MFDVLITSSFLILKFYLKTEREIFIYRIFHSFFFTNKKIRPKQNVQDEQNMSAVPPDLLISSRLPVKNLVVLRTTTSHLLIHYLTFGLQLLSVIHVNSFCEDSTLPHSLKAIIYTTSLRHSLFLL